VVVGSLLGWWIDHRARGKVHSWWANHVHNEHYSNPNDFKRLLEREWPPQ